MDVRIDDNLLQSFGVPDQEAPVPFLGDAYNIDDAEFDGAEEAVFEVKSLNISDDNILDGELVLSKLNINDIPAEYDHVIVGISLSIVEDDLASSARWLIAENIPDVRPVSCGIAFDNFVLDQYLVASRDAIQSLEARFGSMSMSSDLTENVSELVTPLKQLITDLKNYGPLIQPVDTAKINELSQFVQKFEYHVQRMVMFLSRDINGTNWVEKSVKLFKFYAWVKNQVSIVLSSKSELLKKYSYLADEILELEQLGIQYLGSDVEAQRFLNHYEVSCCLLTFFERSSLKTREAFFEYKNKNVPQDAIYAVINLDTVSPKAGYGDMPKSDLIRTFSKGKVDCIDLIREINETKKNVVIGPDQRQVPPPSRRALLEIPCPNFYVGSCPPTRRKWLCQTCQTNVYYGFDEHLHCKCGGAHVQSFTFQCAHYEHASPSPSNMRASREMEELIPMKEHNILILGQSGVGKSTWINATTNYMAFKSLQEAERSLEECDPIVPIPVRFNITDDSMKSREIRVGEDENENLTVGASATQICKTYSVLFGNCIVNLIDTPGLGDNRGVEEDRKNVKKVLDFIRHVDLIHGICILLKPNETRISALLSYCLKEILSNLHQSCSQNLIFCFTNSRATSYKPGETMPILMSLLREINVHIPVPDRTFCLDNEAFRYLCCKTTEGVTFTDKEQDSFKRSWEYSVKETGRLLNAVAVLEPHRTQETLSLNKARRMILSLTRPIADITQNIERNIEAVRNHKKLVEASELGMRDLQKLMQVPQIDLVPTPLGYPRTVCVADRHVRYHTLPQSGQQVAEYIQHCHPHCYLSGVTPEQYPNRDLLGCWAMSGENCHQCSCSYAEHMHILYEQQAKETMTLDEDVKKRIDAQSSDADKKRIILREYEEQLRKLENEKDVILRTCVKFAHFLRSNAIAAYNDAFGDYLDTLIEREESKRDATASDINIKNKLKETKNLYDEEVRIFQLASKEAPQVVSPETIRALERELYELPQHGKQLQSIMEVAIKAEDDAARYTLKSVISQPVQKKKRAGFMDTVKGLWTGTTPKNDSEGSSKKNNNSNKNSYNSHYSYSYSYGNGNTNNGKTNQKKKKK